MSKKIKKPDFFIVGAPKCGTTSMAKYLSQHPEIFIPDIKEPNFFGKDLTGKKYCNNIDEYLELFHGNEHKICGEASTWYLYSKTAAREIYKFNKNAKIIIMLRNPVDVMYSLHSQLVYNATHEDIEDFEEALMAEEDRKKGLRIPSYCHRPEALLYTEVVNFAEQIKRYYEVFKKENIMIIIFEEFVKNLDRIYEDTLRFLGANDIQFKPDFIVYNLRKKYKFKTLQILLRRPPNLILLLLKVFPFKNILKRAYDYILKFNTKYIIEKEIDPQLRKKLLQKFEPEIKRLSFMISKDLSFWLKQ